MKNKFNLLIITALLLSGGLACSGGGDQQGEANKLVDEANKQLEDAKTLMEKAEAHSQKLFGVDIKTVGELAAYKEKMKGEAKDLADDYEKVSEILKDVSKKYDDASRLNVGEKYKEYAKIKSDEFAKRAESVGIHKGNALAFAEVSNPKDMTNRFNENNKKSQKLMDEAGELGDKAKKIEDENKEIFKAK